jgi:hypothetical protein
VREAVGCNGGLGAHADDGSKRDQSLYSSVRLRSFNVVQLIPMVKDNITYLLWPPRPKLLTLNRIQFG